MKIKKRTRVASEYKGQTYLSKTLDCCSLKHCCITYYIAQSGYQFEMNFRWGKRFGLVRLSGRTVRAPSSDYSPLLGVLDRLIHARHIGQIGGKHLITLHTGRSMDSSPYFQVEKQLIQFILKGAGGLTKHRRLLLVRQAKKRFNRCPLIRAVFPAAFYALRL